MANESGISEIIEEAVSGSERLIGLIDGHCDTITAAIESKQQLRKNNLHLDFERLMKFGAPVQVFAIWCDDKYIENAFEYANSVIDFFESELAANSDIVNLAVSYEDIEQNARNKKISAILALEGGEPLMDKVENLNHFYNRGVRLITLTWNRETELGFGVSSDSCEGLKPFGVECVKRMGELGIIVDVSHLNEAGFWDVHTLSKRPYIASHSNAYSIAAHKRNLKDAQIKAIIEKGGLIGLNLYPHFLTDSESAMTTDIIKHIDYFIKLGASGNIGLGCDLDGVEVLPEGFCDVTSLENLGLLVSKTYGENMSNALMYANYLSFFKRFFSRI